MTTGAMIELAIGVASLVAGVMLYRRRPAGPDSNYGSQGAVILLVIAIILIIHALGLLDYRPSPGELEQLRGGSR